MDGIVVKDIVQILTRAFANFNHTDRLAAFHSTATIFNLLARIEGAECYGKEANGQRQMQRNEFFSVFHGAGRNGLRKCKYTKKVFMNSVFYVLTLRDQESLARRRARPQWRG